MWPEISAVLFRLKDLSRSQAVTYIVKVVIISETVQVQTTTPYAINKNQLIFVCNFVKNQRILMKLSLLDLTMNNTCDAMMV